MTFESRYKGNERAVISEDVCGKKVSSRASTLALKQYTCWARGTMRSNCAWSRKNEGGGEAGGGER